MSLSSTHSGSRVRAFLVLATVVGLLLLMLPQTAIGDAGAGPEGSPPTAEAAPAKIEAKNHEGQTQSTPGDPSTVGAYTNGNVSTYQEGDRVNFRFDLQANYDGLSGTMEIRFSRETPGTCVFFSPTLTLGTHDDSDPMVVGTGGEAFSVSLGASSIDDTEYVQEIDIVVGSGASGGNDGGTATIYYWLVLDDNVSGCTGASQHSRLAAPAVSGDFKPPGHSNVPVPANAVVRLPDITITKMIDRDGDGTFESTANAGEYQFTLDGSLQQLTDESGATVFSNTSDGTHTITEAQGDTSGDQYAFVSGGGTNCTFVGATATADVLAGLTGSVQNAECIFYNSLVPGSITIVKEAHPADDTEFTFSGNFDPSGAVITWPMSDPTAATKTFSDLSPGTYTVSELTPGSWYPSAISCSDDSPVDVGAGTATIGLSSGEHVTCAFTNTEYGSITIVKNADPSDGRAFEFSSDLGPFTLTDPDNPSQDFTNLAPGIYEFTELAPDSDELTGLTCSDDSATDLETATASVEIGPGEHVTCTFTNVARGSITIVKDANPGGPTSFDFETPLGNFALSDPGDPSHLFSDLSPDTYSFTELVPPGWKLIDITCDSDSETDLADGIATVTLGAGEDVVCTFTNVQYGSLTIVKDASPADGRTFGFTGDFGSFDLSDPGPAEVFTSLMPGTYTVQELVPDGWALTGISCNAIDATNDLDAGTASVYLHPGEAASCTFTNVEYGSISVVKVADPADDTPFGFESTFGPFTLMDPSDPSVMFDSLLPGNYSITESVPSGWQLIGVSCVANGEPLTGITLPGAGPAAVEIDLLAGQHVVCTYNNAEYGQVTIIKEADPEVGDFDFDGSLGPFTLTEPSSSSQTFSMLPAGTYTVFELVPPGSSLTGLVCSDDSVTDLASATATIGLSPGEHVVCTFANTQEGSITILKVADPADGTPVGFEGSFGPFTLNDPGDPFATFPGLLPGTYTIAEIVPSGWQLTGLECSDIEPEWVLLGIEIAFPHLGESFVNPATSTASVDLMAGEHIICTFSNTKEGSITIIKDADPADDTPFAFAGSFGEFSLTDPSDPSATFDGLLPDTYSVNEIVPDGWHLSGISCVDDPGPIPDATAFTESALGTVINPNTDIVLTVGRNVTCTFTNVEYGSITVIKSADPADDTPFAFESTFGPFTLMDPADPSVTFDDLLPGAFSITESVLDGWTLSNASCEGSDGGYESIDHGVEVDLAAGEHVTCTFANTKRGSITVVKEAQPSDDTVFAFSGDWSFSLSDPSNTSTMFADLPPASYTIHELVPSGWRLTEVACAAPIAEIFGMDIDLPVKAEVVAGVGVTVDLQAGDDVTCTFTNVKDGTITIVKEATPADDTPFVFEALSLGTFTLTDPTAPSKLFEGLAPGTYSFTELVPEGWQFDGASCEPAHDEAIGEPSVQVLLEPGQDITCTFRNSRLGEITIIKQALPLPGQAGEQDFAFGGDLGAFTLDDPIDDDLDGVGASVVFSGLASDSYSVEELGMPFDTDLDGQPDWDLVDITCDAEGGSTISFGGNPGFSPGVSAVDIDLSPGDSVSCTFINTELLTLAPTVRIGDLVWEDADADGVQDPGEKGVEGVVVMLLRVDGEAAGDEMVTEGIVTITTTNGNGNYEFYVDAVDFGQYQVEFLIASDMAFSARDMTDDALDSDPASNGLTDVFVVDGSEPEIMFIDAGCYEWDPEPQLPSTGLSIDRLLVIGGMLVMTGVIALAAARRREDR